MTTPQDPTQQDGAPPAAAPTDASGQQSAPPFDALVTVLQAFQQRAAEDTALRSAVAALGRWLVALADEGDRAAHAKAEASGAPTEPSAPPLPRVLKTLNLGGQMLRVEVPEETRGDLTPAARAESAPPASVEPTISEPQEVPIDLGLVAKRSRLKAECCRWAIERRRRLSEDIDFDQAIKPTDMDLLGRARALPDCFVWPLSPYAYLPEDRVLDDVAGCYDTLADALDLTQRVIHDDAFADEFRERCYELHAEACSALRKILRDCDIDKDVDQDDAFQWLRTQVYHERVYIARHMRIDDPADPLTWLERRDEIAALAQELEQRIVHTKEIKQRFGKIGYISKRWPDYGDDERETQASTLVECIERLIELGVRPSDVRLRDVLMPIIDDLPGDISETSRVHEVLRYIDEHVARSEAEPRAASRPLPPTEQVQQVRELLNGRVAVLIGGQCRPRSREALEAGLGLRELRWITTREHESLSNFEADVRRPDVDLVMLAIRWASHAFEDIKRVCQRHDKPYVRLPRGYGVNQVAIEVLRQASEMLRDRAATAES